MFDLAKSPLLLFLAKSGERIVYRAGGLPITLKVLLGLERDDPPGRIRQAYARHFWRLARPSDWIELAAALLLLPAALPASALWLTLRNGRAVARRSGRAPALQFLDQIGLFFGHGLLPAWYYIFSLHDPSRRRSARNFINRCETKEGVFPLLNAGARSPLDDKAAFARNCEANGLPSIPLILIAAEGRSRQYAALPESDLFIKPVRAAGGRGAERWTYLGEGRYRGLDGRVIPGDILREKLFREAASRPRLVQPRQINHAAVRDLSNGALSTVRVLTCLDEKSRPEAVAATFRMGIGANRTVDNIHAGGIAAALDMETGTMSDASNLGMNERLGWFARHPDTGGLIEGRKLPMWPETRALACRAHQAFGDRVMVGWDIALTEQGLVIVEGNSGPDVDLMQRPLRRGLGGGRFGDLLSFHLAALCEGKELQGRAIRTRVLKPGGR